MASSLSDVNITRMSGLCRYMGQRVVADLAGIHSAFIDKNLSTMSLPSQYVLSGLSAFNGRINETLASLPKGIYKSREMGDEIGKKLEKLEGQLNDAIKLFPHLAKGIEIRFKPETQNKECDRPDLNRHSYKILYDLLNGPESLVLPLPYAFASDSFGSGARAAAARSNNNIIFCQKAVSEDRTEKKVFVGLKFQQEPLSDYVYFGLDEIENISFTPGSDFTPYLAARKHEYDRFGFRSDPVYDVDDPRAYELHQPNNPVLHYLIYRGFEFSSRLEQGHLLVPRFANNLWETRFNNLQSGFLAVTISPESKDLMLYEFHDLILSSCELEDDARNLFLKILSEELKVDGRHVLQYRGDETINRLLRIPVEERHF